MQQGVSSETKPGEPIEAFDPLRRRSTKLSARSANSRSSVGSENRRSGSRTGSLTSEHTYATTVQENGRLVMKTVRMSARDRRSTNSEDLNSSSIFLAPDMESLLGKFFGGGGGGDANSLVNIPKFSPYSLTFYDPEHEKKFVEGMHESMRKKIQATLLIFILGIIAVIIMTGRKTTCPNLSSFNNRANLILGAISLIIYIALFLVTRYSKNHQKVRLISCFIYISVFLILHALRWSLQLANMTSLHVLIISLFSSVLRIQFTYMLFLTSLFFSSFLGIAILLEPNLFLLRYVMPFVVVVLNGCLVSYHMERSEKRKYISEFVIKAYQGRLVEEKEKNTTILNDLYPSFIATSLAKDDIHTLRNVISNNAVVIHITFYPDKSKRMRLTHEYVKQIHKIIDGILSRNSAEKIKSCGNNITAAVNLFGESKDKEITALNMAISLRQYLDVIGIHSVIGIERGITYGCIIQGERSSFDVFGGCVEVSKKLCQSYHGESSKIYVGNEYSRFVSEKFAMAITPGSSFGWEVMKDNQKEENASITNKANLLTALSEIPNEHTSNIKEIIDDLNRAEVIDSRTAVMGEINELEQDQQQSEKGGNLDEMDKTLKENILLAFNQRKDNRYISSLQSGLSIASFLTYGIIDIATLSWCNLIGWEDGGLLVFMRMCIFLPLSLVLFMWQSHGRGENEASYVLEIRRKIPIILGYCMLFYTTFKRVAMFQNLEYGKQGHDFYRDNWTEMYLVVAYAISSPIVKMRDTVMITLFNSITIFIVFVADPYYSANLIGRIATFLIYDICPAITSIFGLFCILEANKKEVETMMQQNDQMALVQREIEQTKQSLLSVMPVEVYESIKNNQYGSDRTYSNTVVLNIRIASLDMFLMGLTISQQKKHIEEIADEICELCRVHEMEMVKSYGSSFVITSGFSDTQKETASIYLSQTILRSFEFATKVQERFGSMASASNGRRMDLHIGMSIGDCVGGIASSVRFSYDIWGEAVLEAEHLSQVCKAHMTLASHRLFGYKDIIKGFRFTREAVPHHDEHNITGYFYIDKEEDVVGRFMEAIEWDTDHFLQTNPIK